MHRGGVGGGHPKVPPWRSMFSPAVLGRGLLEVPEIQLRVHASSSNYTPLQAAILVHDTTSNPVCLRGQRHHGPSYPLTMLSARHWILIAEERAVNWEGRAPIQGTTSAQIVAVAFSPCLFSSRWPTTSHARATLLAEFWRTLRSRSATLLVDQF
ncbi:hypothetical protein CGCF413_v002988 [Colletotrichum fructicola]|nr:hypothetical protein CGCF413_v002988 [Colletotrichum fructicola]